jgi:predicted metal-dependent peptidase
MNAVAIQPIDIGKLSRELQKAHINLLTNDETRFYASTILLGESSIVDDSEVPTACTDGKNKYYGAAFMNGLSYEQKVGVVLHENMHDVLKHIMRHADLFEEDPKTANAAMDYVVHSIMFKINGFGTWIKMPTNPPPLYDQKFDGWSVREVYNYLRKGKSPDGKQEPRQEPCDGGHGDGSQSVKIGNKTYSLGTMDEHDMSEGNMTDEEQQQLSQEISDAIQQASTLAGVLGKDLPRELMEAAAPEVNWEEETIEFITTTAKGSDEYTWRRYNKRALAHDLYLPSTMNERMQELVLAVDASGSMHGPLFDRACAAVINACETVRPERVRVVFWDTMVCSDQTFNDDYDNLRSALKPRGGGGTRAACVVEHIEQQGYSPECIVVITDGYLEDDLKWETSIPTLWLVFENERFTPPRGRTVKVVA